MSMSLLQGKGGAYARDKNTSARLYAKKVGGLMREGGRICGTLRYTLSSNMYHTNVSHEPYHSTDV